MKKNDLILEKAFHIGSNLCDARARLRLSALQDLLIQSAIASADSLGFGFKDIASQQLFWVLSRLQIQLLRPIQWQEVIHIKTWPRDVERILYLRDFTVHNNTGEIIAQASSAWFAIDAQQKKPCQVEGRSAELFTRLKDLKALPIPFQKFPKISSEEFFLRQVQYSDIDLNQHLTASRYVDWMMDSFSYDFHLNNYPSYLQIQYSKETMAGETLAINKAQLDSTSYAFQAQNTEANNLALRAIIKF